MHTGGLGPSPKQSVEAGGLAQEDEGPSTARRWRTRGTGPHRAGLGEPLWDSERWPEVRGQGRERWQPMGRGA